MLPAVLYLRSSKDRHDVSIEAQRRELTELARARAFVIVGEFADVVESGKDEDRPGLQRMLAELYSRERTWSAILMLDTGRLGRGAIAYWFEERDCRPRGVTVVYKSLPAEMDEAERVLMKGVLRGVDHWHSLVSKRKALAGMRLNVRNGDRAGGRAPAGYRLEHRSTGATREGAPVLKSRLVPSDQAPAIAAYLKDRATRIPRMQAARNRGLALAATTLLGLERNALTYAGHTVWNVHAERGAGAARYRPRAEWEIKRDTHAALITELEAEAILARLTDRTRKQHHSGRHDYLLAGLLKTPEGKAWHGADGHERGGFYRHGRGRRILARRVDRAVMNCLTEDLGRDELARKLLEHMQRRLAAGVDVKRVTGLKRRVDELERQIRRLADLTAEAEAPAPLLRAIAGKEREKNEAAGELELLEREALAQKAARALTIDDVRQALRAIAADVAEGKDVKGMRDRLFKLLERVELDPEKPDELVVRYRLTGVLVASPQRHAEYPGALERRVKLAA